VAPTPESITMRTVAKVVFTEVKLVVVSVSHQLQILKSVITFDEVLVVNNISIGD
jgi:DNA-binding cell septation regulator SpoVG